LVPVVYASQETRGRNDTGIYRMLTADGVEVELAFFAKRSPFR